MGQKQQYEFMTKHNIFGLKDKIKKAEENPYKNKRRGTVRRK